MKWNWFAGTTGFMNGFFPAESSRQFTVGDVASFNLPASHAKMIKFGIYAISKSETRFVKKI